ncbi:cytidine deaminase [Aquimarina sp. ERC-38]|uniref:cytidine deaminase n=1 Tax=Aquimarina sp. ERC-38 TaxID=2949996 RepID=UPI0022450AF7|nr:cytidine deaminase [Aquimarina sp. ERC-38]UZO82438.1 cytidine deaminase [Aquimarina sp. ERC-38]
MKEIKITTSLTVFSDISALPDHIEELMKQAIQIREQAYAPYSNFFVGAAILLENQKVVLGNNQENACYPSGLCAERTAIFNAGANYPGVKIEAIAISARSKQYQVRKPVPPCGSCRQAISEYEHKQATAIPIYFMGEAGEVYVSGSLSNLLPFTFDNTYL